MRLRTKRAVPVANDNQLPLPFLGRTRHGTAQLRLPEVPDIEVSTKGDWNSDLLALHSGSLDFKTLVKRHLPLLKTIVRGWLKACPATIGHDDLLQEALIEIMHGVRTFDPSRGIPLHAYVRKRMNFRLHSLTDKLRKGAVRESRFLTQQIVEEKVIVLNRGYHQNRGAEYLNSSSFNPAAFEAVAPAADPDGFDVARTAARIVGGLPSKQARVVAGVMLGTSADVVTLRVYGPKCRCPRKAALRAFAAAHRLVESSRQRTEHVAHESTAEEADHQTTIRFETGGSQVEVATSPHAGEGE